jgi:ribonuclease VapC
VRTADRYVLDSYALLAFFENEPSGAVVERILGDCDQAHAESWLSIINLGEVLYITERERGLHMAQRVVAAIDQLPVRIAEADRTRTFAAAHIKARHAISYADAFAVALAQEIEGKVVTGDPEFKKVEALAPVWWLE